MSGIYDTTDKLPDGLEGTNVPDDFHIPSCGIEDVDRALFDKFDKEIGFAISRKIERNFIDEDVPVIMAGGERFALVKRKEPIRDENGTFVLPLISIYRSGIDQSENMGGLGRGLGQDTGDLVIKKRLSSRDRNYQRIKNALDLKNQKDVASQANLIGTSPPQRTDAGAVGTRREVGRLSDLKDAGELLSTDLRDNIFEIITIPFPEFFVATYEVTFWTQYITHMNQMIETMMSAYDAQHNQFKISSPKGYWFVAFVDSNLTPDDNFQDYTESERLIKYKFTIKCTGYIVAPQHKGQRNPFRRYLSAPQIEFAIQEASGQIQGPRPVGGGSGQPNDFILSDIQELDSRGNPELGRNHSPYQVLTEIEDPFTGKTTKKYARILTRDQRKGETVLRLTDLDNILLD